MKTPQIFGGWLMLGCLCVATVQADEAEQLKKEYELLTGTWQLVEVTVNGNMAKEEDIKKITVVNESDGTWSLRVDGKELSRGTNVLDVTQSPKLIDFYPTDGEGRDNKYFGIYELSENTRQVCFAQSGTERPREFASPKGSEVTLVKFERVKRE